MVTILAIALCLSFIRKSASGPVCGDEFIKIINQRRTINQKQVTNPQVERLFQELSKIATLTQAPGMPSPCYVWDCTHSDHPWKCRWCLPFALIPGISKSGTTELHASLALHPNITSVTKEINIFTTLFEFRSMAEFETKVRAHLSSPNGGNWWVDPYKYWLDGSARCTADNPTCLNAITRYSPATKSLIMVRDPYQRHASMLCMRQTEEFKKANIHDKNSEAFIKWLSAEAYQNSPLRDRLVGFYYILEMKARGHEMLLIDNYDLAFQREKMMENIATFLGMPPFPPVVFSPTQNENSFLRKVNPNTTAPVKTAAEAVYRYNATTTLYLKELFVAEFICALKKTTGTDLHIVTPGG
jgi:hypothetical protein